MGEYYICCDLLLFMCQGPVHEEFYWSPTQVEGGHRFLKQSDRRCYFWSRLVLPQSCLVLLQLRPASAAVMRGLRGHTLSGSRVYLQLEMARFDMQRADSS